MACRVINLRNGADMNETTFAWQITSTMGVSVAFVDVYVDALFVPMLFPFDETARTTPPCIIWCDALDCSAILTF